MVWAVQSKQRRSDRVPKTAWTTSRQAGGADGTQGERPVAQAGTASARFKGPPPHHHWRPAERRPKDARPTSQPSSQQSFESRAVFESELCCTATPAVHPKAPQRGSPPFVGQVWPSQGRLQYQLHGSTQAGSRAVARSRRGGRSFRQAGLCLFGSGVRAFARLRRQSQSLNQSLTAAVLRMRWTGTALGHPAEPVHVRAFPIPAGACDSVVGKTRAAR